MEYKEFLQNKAKKYATILSQKYHPDKIYLFGSSVWGDPTAESDVDLFVIKATDRRRDMVAQMSYDLPRENTPVDVLVYTPTQVSQAEASGDEFIKTIVTQGKLLYEA